MNVVVDILVVDGYIVSNAIPPQEAEGYFGFLAMFVSLDNPASSALTRELVGWRPEHPGLLDDLGEGHYFQKGS